MKVEFVVNLPPNFVRRACQADCAGLDCVHGCERVMTEVNTPNAIQPSVMLSPGKSELSLCRRICEKSGSLSAVFPNSHESGYTRTVNAKRVLGHASEHPLSLYSSILNQEGSLLS